MDLYLAYLRLFLVFPLVLILAYYGLRFFLSRFAPAFSMGRRVQVLERTALNSRTFLYVVKAGDDYLLVGLCNNNMILLKDLGPHWGRDFYAELLNAPLPGQGKPTSFNAVLERLRTGGGTRQKSIAGYLRNLLSVDAKKPNKEEDFANYNRNYKLRKLKEELPGTSEIESAGDDLRREINLVPEKED